MSLERGHEYAAAIINAWMGGELYQFNGNVPNTGLITNLPQGCCVEVPCYVDRNGIQPCHVGDLPPQLAALIRNVVNVHELTVEGFFQRRRDHIYQAALLDPHASAELTIDEIYSMVDDLFEAHADLGYVELVEPGQMVTKSRLVADLITVAGANRYMTIDLHAGQIQGFFTIPGDELTAFHILSDYFLEKKIPNAVVVSPDLGFAKKARNFAEKLHTPLAVIEKRRKSTMRPEALNVIGDVRGKNAILVDDEVLTAGTVVEAVDVLKSRGADRVFISFTHAILADPATERLRSLPLEEIVTTNTVAIPSEKRLPNMIILSVAPLLGEVIRRTHLGISVGEMFNE